MKTSLTGYC